MNDESQQRSEAQYVIGVDIGGTKMITVITDRDGNVVYKQKVGTSVDFEAISGQIKACLQACAVTMEQVAAIGFGVPGITDSKEGTVIEAPAFKWDHMPFKAEIQRFLNKPIYVNNDVNCAALGERWVGTAKNVNDFVVITIGTGVGSAIVANGALIQGSGYMAGEVAYLVMDKDVINQNENAFGDFGLFEKKISGVALSKHGYSAQELFELYRQGEPQAVRVVKAFVQDLSMGIANMVSLLNPQKVILGGGVSQSLPAVLDAIRSTVARFTPIATIIELTSLGEEAGAVGAAAFANEQLNMK
ncbi:ROK family protein [Paenibacillus aestuarii]|uniref:ROK family protein n=1 Tax=Paenibacillus aestuarii TaxID=516965 RepID=A0ABW0K683_9BACL|nr:ROK family protein [Paenibacillus aestuarii]